MYKRRAATTEEVRDDPEEDAAWSKVDGVLKELGYHGMSSDESERDEKGVKTGEVVATIMPWRSSHLLKLLKTVDQDERKTNAYGNLKAGNRCYDRRRKRNAIVSRRPPKGGLPIDFYDEEWYNGLSKEKKRDLGAKKKQGLPVLETVHTDED